MLSAISSESCVPGSARPTAYYEISDASSADFPDSTIFPLRSSYATLYPAALSASSILALDLLILSAPPCSRQQMRRSVSRPHSAACATSWKKAEPTHLPEGMIRYADGALQMLTRFRVRAMGDKLRELAEEGPHDRCTLEERCRCQSRWGPPLRTIARLLSPNASPASSCRQRASRALRT